MPAIGTEFSMPADEREQALQKAVADIEAAFAKLNEQIDQATTWVGAIPSLPNNETRQVIKHLLELFYAPNISDIAAEQSRALKHLGLAIFDCLATLNKFHFTFFEWFIREAEKRHQDFISDLQESHKAIMGLVQTELKRLKDAQSDIGQPPSQQRPTLKETDDDRDVIDEKSLRQQKISEDAESLYNAVEEHYGPDRLREALNQFRAHSKLEPPK